MAAPAVESAAPLGAIVHLRTGHEHQYQLLIDSVIDYAIFILDLDGIVTTWNPGAQRIKGYTREEIIGRHFSVFYPEEDVQAGKPGRQLEVAARDGRFEEQAWRIRKDGVRFWASVTITAMHAPDGEVVGFAKVTRDMRVVDATAEAQYEPLVDSVTDYAIFLLDPTGVVRTWNRGAQRIKGYTREQILGKHFSIFYPEEDLALDKPGLELKAAILDGRFEEEGWRLRKDGTRFWANVIITPTRHADGRLFGFAKVTRDLTERTVQKAASDVLHKSLREKEILLKEIHHRVKNNLQVIGSIISLQSNRTTDQKVLSILKDLKGRIHAIALLHERVYRARDLGRVELSDYLGGIVGDATRAAGADLANTRLSGAQLYVDIDTAVPVGLAVNELVTNALKHGLGSRKAGGLVAVDLSMEAGTIRIAIVDNGAGFPADYQPDTSRSLGMFLVRALAEQLSGTFTVERLATETRCVLAFPMPAVEAHP